MEQTTRYWAGQDKQEECSWDRAAEASVKPWIEAMKDIFARCSKKMAVQVCKELQPHIYAVGKNWNASPVINYDYSMICKPSLQYWSMFIFRRLKINHDSHEIILEFGTVANSSTPDFPLSGTDMIPSSVVLESVNSKIILNGQQHVVIGCHPN